MKTLATFLMVLGLVLMPLTFVGCEKSTEDKLEDAAKSAQKDADDAAKKAADKLGQ